MSEIDTSNKFFVGMNTGGDVFIPLRPEALSRCDALNLAAWIVSLAETEEGEFDKLLAAIRNT